nr:apolipoprotein L2-like [Misgurnus anguillicaudatus]
MDTRDKLQELLSEYVLDTLGYIQTVRDFCDRVDKWILQREMELDTIRDIKDQADKISLKFEHVKNAENKVKGFGEYLWNGLTQVTADSRRQTLEKKLGAVLKDTFEGLEKLEHFLDAVEKLAVTSLFVFTTRFLPMGVSPACVRSVITAARMASSLLIHFKRNNETFFLPILNNVEVLAFQLDKYINITQQLCMKMEKKSKSVLWSGNMHGCRKADHLVKFNLNILETSMQKLLDHLTQLSIIRMDSHTKLAFLFKENALKFIGLFSQRYSRMEQFLSDLEESAVQLDRMKFGANISTVAGSSVGLAGGVLSIVGLALAPVTAGVSLALTLTGVGLGVTSGVNSLVTGITETAVNIHHGKNAQSIFQMYVDDVEKIQGCLEQAIEEGVEGPDVVDITTAITAGKLIVRFGGVGKSIDAIVDTASAIKVLKSEEIVATATRIGLQEAQNTRSIPKLAADLPDIGQLAKGTPLALSKGARAGFITLNALFIGLDAIFICSNSISLAKGSKNETSKLIRSRAALWKSELEAWQKINDSLCIGIWRLRKSLKVLEQPFIL